MSQSVWKEAFRFFSPVVIKHYLAGLLKCFCTYDAFRQFSISYFWASVYSIPVSSRWYEPFGESLSRLKLDTLKRSLNVHFWISNSSKWSDLLAIFRFSPCRCRFVEQLAAVWLQFFQQISPPVTGSLQHRQHLLFSLWSRVQLNWQDVKPLTCMWFACWLSFNSWLDFVLEVLQCFAMNFSGGGSESHSSHCPTKTMVWKCVIGTDHPDVPAFFQFFVNGNRRSQEPACRFSTFVGTIFQPNFQFSNRCHYMACTDVAICLERPISVVLASGH